MKKGLPFFLINTKRTHQKTPQQKNPVLKIYCIVSSGTGYPFTVHPYLFGDGHRHVSSPSLLDTWLENRQGSVCSTFLLHSETQALSHSLQKRYSLIWRNKSAAQRLVINGGFPTRCWLQAYVSETCLCFADNFCTYPASSTFRTSTENVLPGPIQQCW